MDYSIDLIYFPGIRSIGQSGTEYLYFEIKE